MDNYHLKHNIPLGQLVKIKTGERLRVCQHTRGIDGTPNYELGVYAMGRTFGGYGEESLSIADSTFTQQEEINELKAQVEGYRKRVCQMCDGHGMVGNIFDSVDCPDCAKRFRDAVSAIPQKTRLMRFRDLPKGTRFQHPGSSRTWVVLEEYGDGLVAEWNGLNVGHDHQSLCSFVDDEWALDSEVKVIL